MKERKELESAWELCDWNEACESRNLFKFSVLCGAFLKIIFGQFLKTSKVEKMVSYFLSTLEDGSICVGDLVLQNNCINMVLGAINLEKYASNISQFRSIGSFVSIVNVKVNW